MFITHSESWEIPPIDKFLGRKVTYFIVSFQLKSTKYSPSLRICFKMSNNIWKSDMKS